MPTITVEGVEIHHDAFGDGPKCVFVHCTLASSFAWMPVLQALPPVQAITLDMPDHGRSSAMPDGQDAQDTIAKAIMQLSDGPVHLVGHSFGATAALLAAVRMGKQVMSLTMIEPVFFAVVKGTQAFADNEASFAPFGEKWEVGDRMGAAEEFITFWGSPKAWAMMSDAQKEETAGRIHTVPAQTTSLFEDCNGVMEPGVLEGVTCPVHLIEGAKSPAIIDTVHTAFAARLPNATRHLVDGAGHMVPLTHAKQVAEILAQVVASEGGV